MAAPFTRFRSRAVATVLGALIATSGCSLSTDNGGPVFDVLFSATAVETPASAAELSKIEIYGRTSYIEALGGVLVTPCITSNFGSAWQRNGSQITFRLITSPNGANCAAGPVFARSYNAYLTNVEPGTYTVRIVHEGDQLVPSGTVVKETTVSVL